MSVNVISKWDPATYATNAGFVPALGNAVLELLNAQPGEHILDIGAGDGILTAKIAATGADVLAADASAEMLEAAQKLGLKTCVVDGQALDFDAQFDAVFSNAALHWMLDAPAVARGVFKAIKPGGRFVAECGGFGNIAAIRAGIKAVLKLNGYKTSASETHFYVTDTEYADILKAAGFIKINTQLISRPTHLSTGMTGWLKTFRQGFLDIAGVPNSEQPKIMQEISDFLKPILCDRAGNWSADYVRLRFSAFKPE
jgi:ubiquinone/menaquinone biosynthesis C-methylase UbiE